jgi:glycosyltransferase involved in cell wall biosynthesis
MGSSRDLLSVIVPVFNESAVIQAFYDRTTRALAAIAGLQFELIFVDDGSGDDSYRLLVTLASLDPRLRVVKSRWWSNGGPGSTSSTASGRTEPAKGHSSS